MLAKELERGGTERVKFFVGSHTDKLKLPIESYQRRHRRTEFQSSTSSPVRRPKECGSKGTVRSAPREEASR